MDKNQVIGFILIFALLLGWTMMSAPTPEEIAARKEQIRQDSIAALGLLEEAPVNDAVDLPSAITTNDSAAIERLKYSYGSFANAAVGENQEFILENEDIRLTFTTKGGFIKSALIKNHLRVVSNDDGDDVKEALYLLSDEKSAFNYSLPVKGPLKNIDTKDLYFQGSKSGNTVTMVLAGLNGEKLTQAYTLGDSGFHLDHKVSTAGLRTDEEVTINWINYLNKLEKNEGFEKRYSTVYYKDKEEDETDYCGCATNDTEELTETTLDWISHSNQFFNTTLMAGEIGFKQSILETDMLNDQSEALKLLKSDFALSNETNTYELDWYIGPNTYEELAAYDRDLEEIIPFGNSIFGSINRHFIRPFFNFLNTYIGNLGIVIIVLIFIIKMALYPLLYKMLKSQAKMGALKPELKGLKEKFKDEPQKMQMEQMKIYREYGVSPLGGCLPMLIQMPIWYALFRFFPASIIFRQESFLWADDLSSYDVITRLPFEIPFMGDHISLFTILWAISTVVYTYYNTKHMDMSANPAMKYVQYFMPIMFLAFFNSYASGLTCYMLFNNLINIGQTVVTKKFVFDEDKIRAQLMANKAKPKKKSGFQARMEEALKKQQAMAAQQKKKPKRNR